MSKVFIIAEAGVNHNGSLQMAKKMIDVAAKAGADAVKFQTFHAESLVSKSAVKANYQMKFTDKNESQLQMIQRLELSLEAHKKLMAYCKTKKIIFLSSPFDMQSIELLVDLGLEIFKIPSGEITNLPYLRRIGSLRKKIIISTGMATMEEIKDALGVLIKSGTKKEDITVLHCNSAYPTPWEDVNLQAMLTIKKKFGLEVGFSDHTLGIEVSIAAVALGAKVIEKHLTLNKSLPGPDHQASLDPVEFTQMVQSIRNVEKSFGNGIKRPSTSEQENILIARKSIVAAKGIKKGEFFTSSNLCTKRPGFGLNPMLWNKVIGHQASRDYIQDELIEGNFK
ncbi:MAG: N-acetylneuraminate synthase [Candidatus Omnitrophica bacterium]|nr:N-acetylneuraminate synthase [Candidatus Omnitrophota bacterium]